MRPSRNAVIVAFVAVVGVVSVVSAALGTNFARMDWKRYDLVYYPLPPTVRVTDASAHPGGTATVSLLAQNVPGRGLGAATVDVVYDPALLSIVSCTPDPGSVLDLEVCNTLLADRVRLTALSTSGVAGDAKLASIVFTVNPAAPPGGSTPLNVEVITFADPGGGPIPHGTAPGRITFGLAGDSNCDGRVDAVDALFTLQYVVGQRTGGTACPPSPGQIYLPAADVDSSGAVDAVDALFVLQCVAGVPPGNAKPFCTAGP